MIRKVLSGVLIAGVIGALTPMMASARPATDQDDGQAYVSIFTVSAQAHLMSGGSGSHAAGMSTPGSSSKACEHASETATARANENARGLAACR